MGNCYEPVQSEDIGRETSLTVTQKSCNNKPNKENGNVWKKQTNPLREIARNL